jgi:hypothetical protein
MNVCFAAAAVLTFTIGLVHSVLGERLIFRRLRARGFVLSKGSVLLSEAQVRILWASWHAVTALAWSIAVALFSLAEPAHALIDRSALALAFAVALFASAVLVLAATKGRHVGWIGLLAAAVLVALGMDI